MSLMNALGISAMGLTAQRQRIEVISSNLANANTTRTTEGGPYRRKDLVFEAAPIEAPFSSSFDAALQEQAGQGVEVIGVYQDNAPPILKYDPSHPDANADGYVAFPNVSPISEMVNLLSATRSFEASTQAISAIKEIAAKSVEIGR